MGKLEKDISERKPEDSWQNERYSNLEKGELLD